MSSTAAKAKPGKSGATSPYAKKKKEEQAKKTAGKERGGGASKFQRAYAEICTKKMSPPVQADNGVMQGLASPNPIIEITYENFDKASIQALSRLFNMPDLVRSMSGLVFKSNEKDKKKAMSLARKQKVAKKEKKEKKEKTGKKGEKVDEKKDKAGKTKEDKRKEAPQVARPPADLVKTIAKLLFRASSLTQFSVVGVNLSLTDLRMLNKGLSLNKKINLESINFVRVPLGDKGLSELCPALCASGAESVRIVGCNVTDFGGVYIASIIRSHGSKRDEAIWSAGLRGAAVKAHSEECPKEIPRQGCLVLDFSHNRLADNSAQVIGEALANDAWLLGLNVGGNLISEKGGSCLRALVTADNKSIGDEVEKLIGDKITGTAETSAPAAAQLEIVMKAMKAWSRWRATSRDPIDMKPPRAASPLRSPRSSPERKKSDVKEAKKEVEAIEVEEMEEEVTHTADWNSISSHFKSSRSVLKRLQTFSAHDLTWALSSKKVLKSLALIEDINVESLLKISSFGGQLCSFLKVCWDMYASIRTGNFGQGKILELGFNVRKAFKGKKVPLESVGLGGGGGATIVVEVPKVSAPKVKPLKKAKSDPVKSNGGGGIKIPQMKEGESDKQMLNKLETMVEKISGEINRLETKIGARSTPVKKKSPVKKVASPKKGVSPKGSAKKGGDPEMMKEISEAVAARLKEIWKLN
ncbi:hypothetical protein TL16_g06502 [Triparma laevis f. inornata]|uniref:Uncharacterized protein n=1 Tax=Triparma laevis f. inornata TaxID=1714386 RepID=A0A9W7ALQ4_9STRA|nr:hypothetical protein TL16_g06502 [Triparma laevis f. inornata]